MAVGTEMHTVRVKHGVPPRPIVGTWSEIMFDGMHLAWYRRLFRINSVADDNDDVWGCNIRCCDKPGVLDNLARGRASPNVIIIIISNGGINKEKPEIKITGHHPTIWFGTRWDAELTTRIRGFEMH